MLTVQREYGWDQTVEIVAKILVQVDVACGGNGNPAKCELWAAQVLARPDIKGRSLSYLIVSLRDGLSRYTIHDKRIGLEQINKMLNDQDTEIVKSLPGEDEIGEAMLKGEMERMNDVEAGRMEDVRKLNAKVRMLESHLKVAKEDFREITQPMQSPAQ